MGLAHVVLLLLCHEMKLWECGLRVTSSCLRISLSHEFEESYLEIPLLPPGRVFMKIQMRCLEATVSHIEKHLCFKD